MDKVGAHGTAKSAKQHDVFYEDVASKRYYKTALIYVIDKMAKYI